MASSSSDRGGEGGSATAPACCRSGRRQPAALVWFRNDLRLTDHEPLFRAAADLQSCATARQDWEQQAAAPLQQPQQQQPQQQQPPQQPPQQRQPMPLLLPFYCLDDRDLLPRRLPPEGSGLPKLGPHRLRQAWAPPPLVHCRPEF